MVGRDTHARSKLLEEIVGGYFEEGVGDQEDHQCDPRGVSDDRERARRARTYIRKRSCSFR